jgi:hypothetical protein
VLLAKAKDLADRLLKAFDASPHGLPWRYVNLKTGAVRDPETNLAEIGTYITEFGVLGQLTGDDRYFKIAKRAMKHALDRRSKIGLMAANIDARTGEFTSRAPASTSMPTVSTSTCGTPGRCSATRTASVGRRSARRPAGPPGQAL